VHRLDVGPPETAAEIGALGAAELEQLDRHFGQRRAHLLFPGIHEHADSGDGRGQRADDL